MTPPLTDVAVGAELPAVTRTPTAVDLFMFSSAAWLLHRIHYDLPFTTDHDGHPGLLVHGPLQGAYMVDAARRGLGPGARLRRVGYRHLAPAYLGDALECGGTVTAADGGTIDLELWVRKGDGTTTTTGTATFDLGEEAS
jgi:hydroxyacyl-ACP dehydratase HTD2-like protein with hotdog domain